MAKIVSVAIPMVLVTMIVLGITSSAHAQTNATTSTNQTGKTTSTIPSKQASESMRCYD